MLQQTFGNIHVDVVRPSTWLFLDGPTAVQIFFILSGDALSAAYLSNKDITGLKRMVLKRYFRLTIPVLLTVLLTYLIMKFGLMNNGKAGVIVHSEYWLGNFLQFQPSIADALKFALGGVYGWVPCAHIWNVILWTMYVEIRGSFMVFLYIFCVPYLRRPLLTTIALFILLTIFSGYYGLFFIGVFLGQLRTRGTLEILRNARIGLGVSMLLIAAAYLLEFRRTGYPIPDAASLGILSSIDRFLCFHASPIIGILLVCGFYICAPGVWFLETRLSSFLGRISFGLYLMQLPLMCSFESYLIVTHQNSMASINTAFLIAFISVMATGLAAFVFTIIDDYFQNLISAVTRKLIKPSPQTAAPKQMPAF